MCFGSRLGGGGGGGGGSSSLFMPWFAKWFPGVAGWLLVDKRSQPAELYESSTTKCRISRQNREEKKHY
jgi:hypothetical protein